MPKSYRLSNRGLRSLRATVRRNQPWTKSTGPKTAAGKAKVAMNSFVHGERSAVVASFRRLVRLTICELRSGRRKDSDINGR